MQECGLFIVIRERLTEKPHEFKVRLGSAISSGIETFINCVEGRQGL